MLIRFRGDTEIGASVAIAHDVRHPTISKRFVYRIRAGTCKPCRYVPMHAATASNTHKSAQLSYTCILSSIGGHKFGLDRDAVIGNRKRDNLLRAGAAAVFRNVQAAAEAIPVADFAHQDQRVGIR